MAVNIASGNMIFDPIPSEFKLRDMIAPNDPYTTETCILLAEKLTAVRERFQQRLDALVTQQDLWVKKRRDDIEQRKNELHAAREKLAELNMVESANKKEAMECVAALDAGQRDLENLRRETDNALRDREHEEAKLRQTRQKNSEESQRLDDQEKVTETMQQTLRRSEQLCKERLGLELRKVSGQRLQFVITCIDYKQPEQPFTFCLKINQEDRSYSVDSCEPAIKDLDELVKRLNRTNNLRSFVITMRERFKGLL